MTSFPWNENYYRVTYYVLFVRTHFRVKRKWRRRRQPNMMEQLLNNRPQNFFSFSPFCVLHIMITLSVLFYLENIFFFLLTVSSFVADWIMTDRRRCMAAVPCTAWNKRSLVYPGSMHQVSWCQPHPPILADPTNKKKKTFLLLVTLAVRIR